MPESVGPVKVPDEWNQKMGFKKIKKLPKCTQSAETCLISESCFALELRN